MSSQAELERRWQAQRAAKGLPTNLTGVQYAATGRPTLARIAPPRQRRMTDQELMAIKQNNELALFIADVDRKLAQIRRSR